MSMNDPGVIFDATCSWNGYNHQGKLALWCALKEIRRLCKEEPKVLSNPTLLDKYFLELEYLEDFSIGKKEDNEIQYITVHQVKDHNKTDISEYDSALLGLACHIREMPKLEKAYLHTVKQINFTEDTLLEHLKIIVSNPTNLNKTLKQIKEIRNDCKKQEKIIEKKTGRLPKIEQDLKRAYADYKQSSGKIILDKTTLLDALNALECQIKKQIKVCSSMTEEQLEKIKLYPYLIDKENKEYCPVDKIKGLLKNEIKNITELLPEVKPYWNTEPYIDKRYLFLLGKLDEHIIDRNLNYSSYKSEKKDRKISLKTIYKWLIDGCIDETSDEFYLYHIKEAFFNEVNKYCSEKCKKDFNECSNCAVHYCLNKIGNMTNNEMCKFLYLTNPAVHEKLSMDTYRNYADAHGLHNPFIKGLCDIPSLFDEKKIAITYNSKNKLQYVLTTLLSDDGEEDYPFICSDILKNRELYDILMDCDCFISKDIEVDSIPKMAIQCGPEYTEQDAEHIAKFKNVKIDTLKHFIKEEGKG